MNPEVDWFFEKTSKWKNEYAELRFLALECDLTEELKWGCPCYVHGNKNIVLIHGFKNYCALLFFQGALLADTKKLLIQQTENVQSARQMRFTNVAEISALKSTIKTYINNGIALSKSDRKVELKKTEDYEIPEEFRAVLNEMPDVKQAFESLTPGRQRGYLLFFSTAKQSATREARIQKNLSKILAGKGLND